MLMGMGDGTFDTLVAQALATPPPAGSPAANALITSTTPNAIPTSVPILGRAGQPATIAPTTVAQGTAIASTITTTYPLGLTGTQWLMILGGAALVLYFVMSKKHKGGGF